MAKRTLSDEGDCVRFTLRLPPKMDRKLEKFCTDTEQSRASVIRDAIRRFLLKREYY